jgi:hypothetical protein
MRLLVDQWVAFIPSVVAKCTHFIAEMYAYAMAGTPWP